MEYLIYLSAFLLAGFIFGKILNSKPKKDYNYETAMLNAHIKLLKDPEYVKILEATEDLKRKISNRIEYPIHFGNSYWTCSDEEFKKIQLMAKQ